ncbi:MAG: response regulator [Acidobacteriota bacterium]|nr:response regulator [Acidobacteriota bacterium]
MSRKKDRESNDLSGSNAPSRILIVDDEVAVRTSPAAFLEDHGHEIMVTDSAEEALTLFGRNSFDIAIVDLRLPGMTGDILIARAHERDKSIRFLIHTGSVDFSLTDELRQLGMTDDHVLNKPRPDLNTFSTKIAELDEERV